MLQGIGLHKARVGKPVAESVKGGGILKAESRLIRHVDKAYVREFIGGCIKYKRESGRIRALIFHQILRLVAFIKH